MARRRHSKRRRRGGFLYKLVSTLLISGAIVLALTLFFRVETITVTGQVRYTAQQIVDATGVERGDNLFLLNKYRVTDNIVTALPYIEIEGVRIRRQLPDTLVIQVEECGTPLAVVQEGVAWLVSPSGKIVDRKDAAAAEQYGTIEGCTLLAPSVGTKLALATEYAEQQQSLLELLAALEEADMIGQVDAVHLEDLDVLAMDYGGRFRVEMNYGADYARDLRLLTLTLEKLEDTETGTIQLTWDDGTVHIRQN